MWNAICSAGVPVQSDVSLRSASSVHSAVCDNSSESPDEVGVGIIIAVLR